MTASRQKRSLDPERFAVFAEAWRRRARRREAEERRRGEEARAAARRAAAILAERYGVTRVVLFGSLVGQRRFGPSSDIDLAVEGLAPERFFRADAELAREICFPAGDLLPGGSQDPLRLPPPSSASGSSGKERFSMRDKQGLLTLAAEIRQENDGRAVTKRLFLRLESRRGTASPGLEAQTGTGRSEIRCVGRA